MSALRRIGKGPVFFLVAVIAAFAGGWALAGYIEDPPSNVVVAPEDTATPEAPGTAEPDPVRLQVALLLDDPERDRYRDVLEGAGYEVVAEPGNGAIALSREAIDDATPLVVEAWAAVTDQRRDVLEITAEDARAILAGEITNWAELGGSDMEIAVYLPRDHAELIGAALGPSSGDHVTLVDRRSLPETVAEQPGAFALLPAPDLQPGMLALVVDDHDPYRDPEIDSPLRLERWVSGADDAERDAVVDLVGWAARDLDLDPVGLLGTGEILPVRCSYHALVERGDDGAMFDGTRELLQAADLVVSQLDTALTDRVPPSPCVSSFDLRAPTRLAEAFAEAGVRVMSTATNHHMDCDGCGPPNAMRDTLQALRDAGIEPFGSGENLEEARQPVFIEEGGVRFAFLGYDAIAADWYGASPATPGTAPLRWSTLDSLAEDVANAKAQADHVIVLFSWSFAEYVTWPDDLQRSAAHVIEEAGGSLIIGNGPHIVQAAEMVNDMFVAYSLGNFIYDQEWSIPPGADGLSNYETVDNVVLEVGFTPDRMLGYRFRPAVIREMHRPDLVDPATTEGQRIMSRLWDAVDALPPWEGATASRP